MQLATHYKSAMPKMKTKLIISEQQQYFLFLSFIGGSFTHSCMSYAALHLAEIRKENFMTNKNLFITTKENKVNA
ncbi:hypothetical protein T01_15642 [Trichinella spiralis]|uniref:Uncharacterized protein n=1 Tax=Trichinella spiralis TaxID=6334 RepID=A0A0V1BAJ2_TRISP|nr:hypothetical protein T01_15642 [Trichinella spiralis]